MSAVFDDEADAFELRRVMDEAAVDGELRDQWRRLNIMRDVMRKQDQHLRPSLRDAIFSELAQGEESEPVASPQLQSIEGGRNSGRRKNWLGRATGVLVASAAAVLVMVNGGLFDQEATFENPTNSLADAQIGNAQELVPVMYSTAKPVDQQRQYGFMMRHIQQNAMTSNAVASFVKMATFERKEMGSETETQEQTSATTDE